MYASKLPDFSKLLSELPPIVARRDLPKLLGGIISRGGTYKIWTPKAGGLNASDWAGSYATPGNHL